MVKRKPTIKYYFSVEGETEHWYLKWLQDVINNTEKAACKVSIECPVSKNPLKHVKSMTVTRRIDIYHFFDYESSESLHVNGFQEALDNMKKAEKIGKQYITPINQAFGEKFANMDEFKEENNFKRCLKKMNLSNVISAIERSKKIMLRNNENGYKLCEYKGYKYYRENPSLAVWESIEKILKDCELV